MKKDNKNLYVSFISLQHYAEIIFIKLVSDINPLVLKPHNPVRIYFKFAVDAIFIPFVFSDLFNFVNYCPTGALFNFLFYSFLKDKQSVINIFQLTYSTSNQSFYHSFYLDHKTPAIMSRYIKITNSKH